MAQDKREKELEAVRAAESGKALPPTTRRKVMKAGKRSATYRGGRRPSLTSTPTLIKRMIGFADYKNPLWRSLDNGDTVAVPVEIIKALAVQMESK